MKVKLKVNDPSNGLKKGQIFEAKPYPLDPGLKFTIYDEKGNPICNQDRRNCEIIPNRVSHPQ